MLLTQVGVFVPKETNALFSFHFSKCWVQHKITVYNDVDEFVNSHHDKKIACFQMPYPVEESFNATVDNLLPACDHVLILMSELHDRTVDFIVRHDHAKVSYFICGELNFQVDHSPVHKFYDWFTTTVHFYKHERPQLLSNSLTPYTPKGKYFDVLLGRQKPHRDLAYNRVDKDYNIVTYLKDQDFGNPASWLWPADLKFTKPVEWTVDRVNYEGYNMSLSQIVPLDVYNQTVYSLIAETNYSNHYSFYTEKTVKPILGQRLFITLNGQHALRNLRAIGFKTFDTVIDESYDEILDFRERTAAALLQLEYLCTRPQEEILERIKPICEHNYSHMMRTNWYEAYFMPAFINYFNQ